MAFKAKKAVPNSLISQQAIRNYLLGPNIMLARGLLKFIPAVPKLLRLVLPGSFFKNVFAQNKVELCTGFSSQIGTKLRDWAVGQAWGSCYSWAALSSNDSKTLYKLRHVSKLSIRFSDS